MVKQGVLRRAARRRGVVLSKSKTESKAPPAQKVHAGAHSRNGTPPAKTPAAAPATRNGQPSLQSVLIGILTKSRKPLSAQELADQAHAGGYESKSKDFRNVVWTTLGKMNVEKVPDKGFRLK